MSASTLDLMVADCRSLLNEPAGIGHGTDYEIAKWINRGQQILARQMMADDTGFFEESDTSLGFIKDQEEYDLPDVCRDRIITKLTRTDLSENREINFIRFQRKDRVQSTGIFYVSGTLDGLFYYIRGNKLGIKPTPTTTIANNIELHYLQLPHDLLHADAKTPTTTTITFPTVTTGAAPILRAGRISTAPNYYVNARLRFIEGAQRGLEVKITAWNSKTLVATITPTLTAGQVTDITNKQFVILSPLPEEFQQACFYFSTMMMGIKKKNPDLISQGRAIWSEVYKQVEDSAEIRHLDENTHVEPPVDDVFDGI